MPTLLTYIEIYNDNGTLIVAIKGPLNVTTVDEFNERLDELLQEVMQHIILDFSDAEYISSMGLKVILDLGKRLKREGTILSLVTAQPLVREIFEASGFTMLFGLYATIEEAKDKGLNHNLITD